jgi:protein NEDD1
MEILKGQIVDRVRNVLLDTRQQVPDASTQPVTVPPLQPPIALSAQSIKTLPIKDLWMQIGLEGAGGSSSSPSFISSSSAAVGSSSGSKPKAGILGQSALPATPISSLDATQSSVPFSSTFLPPTGSSSISSSSFPTKILEGVIEGCLMDFRAGIRSDIQNMHLELLRQFQIQKMEIEGLLQHYTDLKDVREENERLLEENRKLRLNYWEIKKMGFYQNKNDDEESTQFVFPAYLG